MVMESTQLSGRFWPLSPRLWRRSNEYSRVTFEPRKPPFDAKRKVSEHCRNSTNINNVPPDILRSRSFIRDRLDPLNIDIDKDRYSKYERNNDENKTTIEYNNADRNRWSAESKRPPIKENKRSEDVVKLRTKRQRQPRPNSLQLLLCPSGSGHYISNTWRYTRVRSRRLVLK